MEDTKAFAVRTGPRANVIAVTRYGEILCPRLIHTDGGGQIITPEDLKGNPGNVAKMLRDWLQMWLDQSANTTP